MVATALIIGIIADSVSMLILFYILFSLLKSDEGNVKEYLLKHYEFMKRDKIFRGSLGILAFSLALAIAAAGWTLYSPDDRAVIDTLLAGSGVFKMVFFLYLLKTVKTTAG
jgi:small-conductance mechanosensitive channel